MSELKRLFPEPCLSAFFSARVIGKLPGERPAPKWMRAYWAGVAGLTLVLAPSYLPLWLWYVSVPVGFALGVTGVEVIGRSGPSAAPPGSLR